MAKIVKATKGLLKLLDGDVSIQRLIDTGFLDSALAKDSSFVMQKNIIDGATKRYKEARKNNPYFDEREKIAEYHMIQGQDAAIMKKEAYNNILNIIHEIKKRLKNENELLCINSVITIFQHIDELDLLNKSAILLYIKELSGLSQKQLTTSLHSIKKHYRELKKDDKFELF